MREMILAATSPSGGRRSTKLLPIQRADFVGIFKAMQGRPVTIRTLDPPLHEFLPHDEAGMTELAKAMGVTLDEVRQRVEDLAETNPMLGLPRLPAGHHVSRRSPRCRRARSSRPPATSPKTGMPVQPEIMIPLVGTREELENQSKLVVTRIAEKVFAAQRPQRRIQDRHDDRGAARRPCAPTRSPRRPSSSPSARTT